MAFEAGALGVGFDVGRCGGCSRRLGPIMAFEIRVLWACRLGMREEAGLGTPAAIPRKGLHNTRWRLEMREKAGLRSGF